MVLGFSCGWLEQKRSACRRAYVTWWWSQGDWRGISRQFVTSRTPSQVASHAQKYFLRQSTGGKRKRRASLFDMSMEENEGSKATAEMSNDGSANSISIASIYPSRTLHATKAQQRSPGGSLHYLPLVY